MILTFWFGRGLNEDLYCDDLAGGIADSFTLTVLI